MTLEDFYNDFLISYDNKDLSGATTSIMQSVGHIASTSREDFIDLLKEAGVEGDFDKMDDNELINKYVDSLSNNKDLQLGTMILIGDKVQKTSSFDGDDVSNESILAGYHTLKVYFNTPSENYYAATGVADAIAEGAKLGGKILDTRNKNKFGVIDTLRQREEAKQVIAKQIVAQRQAELENKKARQLQNAKTTRTLLIVLGVTAVVGITTYFLIKKKK